MERDCEEGEMEKKLRLNCRNNRPGPSTPPPTWRLQVSSPPSRVGAFTTKEFLGNSEVSVRKLCADLWETEQFRRRIQLRRRDSDLESSCGGSSHDHQSPSGGSSRKQIAAKRESTNDRKPFHKNGERLQRISPSSYSKSSLEVGSSSASYGLTSSTKLLKVLNRIWSLEEQNTALKIELDECRAGIKKVSDKRGKKQTEEEVFRSIMKELDDERKVRKQSESLHRKLTRELCEAKHCLAKALKDLEKERKERVFVENLYASRSRKVGSDLRAKPDDSDYMHHQKVCLKELDEKLENGRRRRDNKLVLKKKSSIQVFNLSMSSEGDKIHPEASPRNVDEGLEKSRTFAKILPDDRCTLKDKLMEARVESRRFRSSLKLESSPSLLV